jgi:hypothetical protein
MSLHATYMAAAGIGGLLRASGEAIEYTEHNGQPVPLTALVTTELARLNKDQQGEKTVKGRTFTITKDPAGEFGGVEDPQENGVVTYGEIEYAVTTVQDGGSYWELECDVVGRIDRSRPRVRSG